MTACRRLLPTALAGLVLVSCADRSPTGVGPRDAMPVSGLQGLLLGSLVQCEPAPYDSVTHTVGPAGGVIPVGSYQLDVPAGALDAPVTITAVAPVDTVNRVTLRPAGLVFARPARLTMSYANCNLFGMLLPKRIAYVSDGLDILELLQSLDQRWLLQVSTRLDHFSSYAVAW